MKKSTGKILDMQTAMYYYTYIAETKPDEATVDLPGFITIQEGSA